MSRYNRGRGRRRGNRNTEANSNEESGWSRFTRGSKDALGIALSALAVANATKRLINVEFKNCRKTFNAEDITNAGSVDYLNPIAEGDGADDRNGNSIRGKSFMARLRVTYTAGGNATQWIRLMLFQDLQSSGVVPAVDEVLDTVDVSSPRNLQWTRRFRTIWDRTITLTAEKGGEVVNVYKKINSVIRFIDTDATQASSGNGSFYLLSLSEQAGANYPTLDGVIRLRYIDN